MEGRARRQRRGTAGTSGANRVEGAQGGGASGASRAPAGEAFCWAPWRPSAKALPGLLSEGPHEPAFLVRKQVLELDIERQRQWVTGLHLTERADGLAFVDVEVHPHVAPEIDLTNIAQVDAVRVNGLRFGFQIRRLAHSPAVQCDAVVMQSDNIIRGHPQGPKRHRAALGKDGAVRARVNYFASRQARGRWHFGQNP